MENNLDPHKIAKLIADTWNRMSKQHGWPTRTDDEAVMRSRKVLTACMAGLNGIGETSRSQETLIQWVLGRWNWETSPAPLALAGNSNQWATLKDSLQMEEEEAKEDMELRLKRVSDWVKLELTRRTSQGMLIEKARKEVAEYAKITGKDRGWNQYETARFQEELNLP